jgi:DNA-binding MarR family transcriptional regulator
MDRTTRFDLTPLHLRVLGYFSERVLGSTTTAAVALHVAEADVERACDDLQAAGLLATVDDRN